jgi:hypothetical protein
MVKFNVSGGVLPLAFAGLAMMRICTGSTPTLLGPVQVSAVPSLFSMVKTLVAPVTQISIWLVAPPLLGAPVTYG